MQVKGIFRSKKRGLIFLLVVSLLLFGQGNFAFNCFGGYFVYLCFKDKKYFEFMHLGSEPIERLRWKLQNKLGMIDEATFRQWRCRGRGRTRSSRTGLALSSSKWRDSALELSTREGGRELLVF